MKKVSLLAFEVLVFLGYNCSAFSGNLFYLKVGTCTVTLAEEPGCTGQNDSDYAWHNKVVGKLDIQGINIEQTIHCYSTVPRPPVFGQLSEREVALENAKKNITALLYKHADAKMCQPPYEDKEPIRQDPHE